MSTVKWTNDRIPPQSNESLTTINFTVDGRSSECKNRSVATRDPPALQQKTRTMPLGQYGSVSRFSKIIKETFATGTKNISNMLTYVNTGRLMDNPFKFQCELCRVPIHGVMFVDRASRIKNETPSKSIPKSSTSSSEFLSIQMYPNVLPEMSVYCTSFSFAERTPWPTN